METPEDKAWTFFRKVLDNDEKYFTFKNKKEPIMLEGSAGGKYFLYPNGNIARLDKDKPHVGRISFGQKMPLPDFLSSIVVWITKNEHALKQRWGCGTINVYYGDGQAQYEDGHPLPNIRDVLTCTGSIADWATTVDTSCTYLVPSEVYDLLIGGDGGHGENQIPEQERRRNTDTST